MAKVKRVVGWVLWIVAVWCLTGAVMVGSEANSRPGEIIAPAAISALILGWKLLVALSWRVRETPEGLVRLNRITGECQAMKPRVPQSMRSAAATQTAIPSRPPESRIVERCENCHEIIGDLQTPWIWNDHTVCFRCHEALARGGREGYRSTGGNENAPDSASVSVAQQQSRTVRQQHVRAASTAQPRAVAALTHEATAAHPTQLKPNPSRMPAQSPRFAVPVSVPPQQQNSVHPLPSPPHGCNQVVGRSETGTGPAISIEVKCRRCGLKLPADAMVYDTKRRGYCPGCWSVMHPDELPRPITTPPNIAGWLVLPAFGMVIGSLLAVSSIVAAFQRQDAAIVGMSFIWAAVFIAIAVMFFMKKRVAVKATIGLLVVNIIIEVLALGLLPEQASSGVAMKSFIYCCCAAAWIAYFLRSRRVRVTFVR